MVWYGFVRTFLNAFFFHFSLMMIGSELTRVAASKMNSKASNSVVAGPNLAAGSLCRSVPRVWSCKGEVCNDQCNQVQLQMIWAGSDEALASNSSVRALLQNSAWFDIFMMHNLWSKRPRGRTQQGPQAQFKLSRSMLHLPSEEVQGARGCGSNIRRFVCIRWCVPFTFGVCLQIGVYKRPFFSWGSLLRSNKDQKGSVPLAPQILLGVDECNLRSVPDFEAQGSHVEVDTSVGKAEDGPAISVHLWVKIVRSNSEKCNTFESSIQALHFAGPVLLYEWFWSMAFISSSG